MDRNLIISVMALVGFSASAIQALKYHNGDYMVLLNKKAYDGQSFILALGLFWDIVMAYFEHPMALVFLNRSGIVSPYQVSITLL